MQGTKNLTEGPIRRQLFNLALPIMGTSFIQMAYSITDMAWVGRIGSEAVAAVGAVGILTWMTTSFSYLNKVGAEGSLSPSAGGWRFSCWRNPSSACSSWKPASLQVPPLTCALSRPVFPLSS